MVCELDAGRPIHQVPEVPGYCCCRRQQRENPWQKTGSTADLENQFHGAAAK